MQRFFYHFIATWLIFMFLIGISRVFANNQPWVSVQEKDVAGTSIRYIKPDKATYYKLDIAALKTTFSNCPMERAGNMASYGFVVSLPMPNGEFQRFAFSQYHMMEPALVEKWPFVSTYTGQGIDDKTAVCKVDFTTQGFHAMVLREEGTTFIDPVLHGETLYYQVYRKADLNPATKAPFVEYELEEGEKDVLFDKSGHGNASVQATGGTRREYRIAIAATAEYTAFQGGATNAASAITTTLNRVNGVYEKEVCIRMNLVANNNLLIYTVASTDPYTNGAASTMLNQNQSNITTVIGTPNYDIGHVFGTNSGGVAGAGVVCNSNNKARGVTGSSAPVGDPFDIDYVAHEVGHQFSGSHTFNSVTGSCGGGNREADHAYEPGSGTTIMAYAGICGNDDIQNNSNDYFNFTSYEQITNYSITGQGNSCAAKIITGNNPPTIPAITGGYVLPINTPFMLTSTTATDPDGESVTYCWEEFDLGNAGAPGSPTGDAPIFRSFSPTTSPIRIFPKIADVVSGVAVKGEKLPTYARNLKFKLTARDNRAGSGGVNSTSISMTVVATAGPFAVSVPNLATVSWEGGSTQTVTWSVANTSAAPINSKKVTIKLSTDGGTTYPYILKDSTNNDGSQAINLPFVTSNTARIMVQSYDKLFFDISNANFKITAPTTASIAYATTATAVCPGQSFKVGYDPTGTTFVSGNNFNLQLSNASGQFTNPVTIGSIQSIAADSIVATIPMATAAGTGYKMRIVTTNPVRTSILEKPAPQIKALAPLPGTITGAAEFCPNATQLLYKVAPLAGVAGYTWTLPAGAAITSNPDSNAVYVTAGTAGGTVTVQSINGCGPGPGSSMAVSIIAVQPAQITATTQATSICEGATVQFTSAPLNQGSNPAYQWLKNGTAIAGANQSSYTGTGFANDDKISVVLTSSLTCGEPNVDTSNIISLTVTPLRLPVATVESNALNDTTCTGEVVTFSATPTFGGAAPAYQWYKNTTLIAGANQNTYAVSNLTSNDSIRVRLTSNASCLSTSVVFSKGIKLAVMNLVVNAGVDTTVCQGYTPFLLKGNPAGGSWSGSGILANGLFSNQTPNAYIIQYNVSKYGCDRSDSRILNVNPLPAFLLGADATICENVTPFAPNGQTGINCNGPGLNNGLFNPALAGLGPKQIICSKTANGCTKTDTVTYDVIEVDTVFYSVSVNTLTANISGASYQWYLAANPINGATSASYTITASGVYCVEVMMTNGCKRKSLCQNQTFTGMENLVQKGELLLFPNPAGKSLFIKSPVFDGNRISIRIVNTLGQHVLQIDTRSNGDGIEVPVTALAPGFYSLILADDAGNLQKTSFIKK